MVFITGLNINWNELHIIFSMVGLLLADISRRCSYCPYESTPATTIPQLILIMLSFQSQNLIHAG